MEPIVTSFQAFRLTIEELQVARQLNAEQRAYYQTLLADAAEERLSVKIDPYKPLECIQVEAYLRGQIDILNMLLNTADDKISRPKDAIAVQQP